MQRARQGRESQGTYKYRNFRLLTTAHSVEFKKVTDNDKKQQQQQNTIQKDNEKIPLIQGFINKCISEKINNVSFSIVCD